MIRKKFIFGFFAIFFVASCSSAYDEHFYNERNNESLPVVWYWDFTNSWEIISFPNEQKENIIINKINAAQKNIFIEIYTFTRIQSIFDALVEARKRGVDVRILLEGNVYGTPAINNNAFYFFRENNIPVAFTDNNRYTFTHAKFWIIDDEYGISTGNWTRSFFDKNREYIYFWKDSTTKNFLQKIFERDFSHQGFVQTSDIPTQIVMSPIDSRQKIENFISNSKSELWLYVQTISDERILELIHEKSNAWVKIHICSADNEESRATAWNFSWNWKFAINPYLHAKIMLSDSGNIFIWSENFTQNALDNNREMWIFLKNRIDIYNKIREDIVSHCES